jgi:hypothetical protein
MELNGVVLFSILALAIAAGTAMAEAPASFALWSARETNYSFDVMFAKAKDGGDVLRALPRAKAHWQRGVAVVAMGQTRVCRKRIYAYSVAVLKYFNAEAIYVRGHRATRVGAVARVLNSAEPFARLTQAKEKARARASFACG